MDPRRLIPVLAVLAVFLVALATALALGRGTLAHEASADSERPGGRAEASSQPDPRAVLTGWDQRRARAWADGDTDALRRLYVPDSSAGRADVALLEAYAARGLTVDGMQTQVLALDVLRQGSDRIVVEVTDRTVGARAIGGEGAVDLPRAAPAPRQIELVLRSGEWLVVEARLRPARLRPARQPARD